MDKILDVLIILVLVTGLFMAGKGMMSRIHRDIASINEENVIIRIIS